MLVKETLSTNDLNFVNQSFSLAILIILKLKAYRTR